MITDDHTTPCATSQVLKSQIDQLFKDREQQNSLLLTMMGKMDTITQIVIELKTETKTRLDHLEKGHSISNDIIDTHVKQSEEYRKKVELCDGFRTSAQWGIGILFAGVVGQIILSISEMLHMKQGG